MSSSADQGAVSPGRANGEERGLFIRNLATSSRRIVGLSELSQMTPKSGSAVDVLGPVICMAYAALA